MLEHTLKREEGRGVLIPQQHSGQDRILTKGTRRYYGHLFAEHLKHPCILVILVNILKKGTYWRAKRMWLLTANMDQDKDPNPKKIWFELVSYFWPYRLFRFCLKNLSMLNTEYWILNSYSDSTYILLKYHCTISEWEKVVQDFKNHFFLFYISVNK